GLFTITANRQDTDLSSQMTMKHIVKPTATETTSKIQLIVPSRNYRTAHLPRVKTLPALDCGSCISELRKEALLAARNAIPDVHLLPKRSTLDSLDVEHQKLLVDGLPPRNVKSWKWALVVSAILSSLFLF